VTSVLKLFCPLRTRGHYRLEKQSPPAHKKFRNGRTEEGVLTRRICPAFSYLFALTLARKIAQDNSTPPPALALFGIGSLSKQASFPSRHGGTGMTTAWNAYVAQMIPVPERSRCCIIFVTCLGIELHYDVNRPFSGASE